MSVFYRLFQSVFGSDGNDSRSSRKRKRRDSQSDGDDNEEKQTDESADRVHTPIKKKLKSTGNYIYQTFFVDGKDSDVTIEALGKQWKLHKAYLCQSDYFSSMFDGNWKESELSLIQLDIPDGNITAKALDTALGSLYREDVHVTPAEVISVLAAALLLQLVDLCQQCQNIMKETIYDETAAYYHTAAKLYGLADIEQKSFQMMLKNLMPMQTPALLKSLSKEQLSDLLNSSKLFVMQVEMDIYNLVKKWVFLQLNISWAGGSKQDLITDTQDFFRRRAEGAADFFLRTEEGSQFASLFHLIRFPYIISDLNSEKVVLEDRIIPTDWLDPVYKLQWRRLLRLDQGFDMGPSVDNVSLEVFNTESMRCGRVLSRNGEYCWRWIGFCYGFDLIITYCNRVLSFRRNTTYTPCSASVSQVPHRQILYRFSVISADEKGNIRYEKETELINPSLSKDEEQLVMTIERKTPFPLYIGLNILFFTPEGVVVTQRNDQAPVVHMDPV